MSGVFQKVIMASDQQPDEKDVDIALTNMAVKGELSVKRVKQM